MDKMITIPRIALQAIAVTVTEDIYADLAMLILQQDITTIRNELKVTSYADLVPNRVGDNGILLLEEVYFDLKEGYKNMT